MRAVVGYLFALMGFSASAQVSTSVPADIAEKLDAHHLYLDARLDKSENHPYAYSGFREAAAHFGDSCTLYIAPNVYWVDDPDHPEVVTGQNGREPFGIVIRAKKLHFIGLSDDARQTILASQRGQMQGAVGNFTMFDFWCELSLESVPLPQETQRCHYPSACGLCAWPTAGGKERAFHQPSEPQSAEWRPEILL